MTSGTISIDNVQRVHELSRRCDENARRVMRVTTKCLLKLLERVTERANRRTHQAARFKLMARVQRAAPRRSAAAAALALRPPDPRPKGGGPPRETSNLSRALATKTARVQRGASQRPGRAASLRTAFARSDRKANAVTIYA